MDIEKKAVKLVINKANTIIEDLILYEEAPDENEKVLIEITIDRQKISFKSENFFSALLSLRKELETKNIQIMCNGAAKNVYPSAMQMSMGSGRVAYKLCLGKQARNADIVDIFDCEEGLDFVGIDEQLTFYNKWIKSIMG